MEEARDTERIPRGAKRTLLQALLLLAVYCSMVLNWFFESLRFSYSPLNYLVFLIALTLPFVIVFFGFRFSRIWMRVVTLVSMLPLMVLSALLMFGTSLFLLLIVLELGRDPTFEKVRSVEAEHYRVSVYRVDVAGATGGGGGVQARQEKSLLPGLLLVRRLYTGSGSHIDVSVVDEDHIKVYAPPATVREGREFELKRFVYL